MLNIDELANEINKALAVTDKDGQPIKTTDEMKTYAKAVINTLKAASTTHLPGTVTADTVAGAPITNGQATNGVIVNMSASLWSGINSSGFSSSDPVLLAQEASLSTVFIMGAGRVDFSVGNISGISTATPTAPGILANGQGINGVINGLSGDSWASVVNPPLGDISTTKKVYNAIVNYINKKATVSYSSGQVTGVTPAVSGPISGAAALLGLVE